jgi:UDP-3-O-acyl-N-acetylglucosamine deacetylase
MIHRRRTLVEPVRLTGLGLHSGHPVSVTIHPAVFGYGYQLAHEVG